MNRIPFIFSRKRDSPVLEIWQEIKCTLFEKHAFTDVMKNAYLTKIRDSLLPKLLSGKIQLSVRVNVIWIT